MWVFGYGSLMGDNWETGFNCSRRCTATLPGYRRVFNKASTRNRGTQQRPCPTLNLEAVEHESCKGIAFRFDDAAKPQILERLREREGTGFTLAPLTVRLDDGEQVIAIVPIYQGRNEIARSLEDRAAMVVGSVGTKSSCKDYVKGVADLLAKVGIEDAVVSEFWEAVKKQHLNPDIIEVRERLLLLESHLPQQVDGIGLCRHSKIPFKVLTYRESLAWRMAELSRGALDSFECQKVACGIILTRAAVETSAALWHLSLRIERVTAESIGELDDYLMKLILGTRNDPDMPQAINVLTFIDAADKDIPGFRERYDLLSEFVHPNWAGTTLLFSKFNPTLAVADYGSGIRGAGNSTMAGLLSLSGALSLFEATYNKIADLTPSLVAIFEERERRSSSQPS